jgi:hypothetical protein
LVLVTADLISVPLDLTRRVRKTISDRHGIEAKNILIAASHTHCGPATLPSIGLVPRPKILKQIEEAFVSSADRAVGELEPVTLGVGASAAHFNVNRRPFPGQTGMAANDAGVIDRRVRVLKVDRTSGSPLALLFHYSCHPTTKNGSDGLISPDYPGLARARIERTLGCRAAFLPGCFGNIRPRILDADGNFVSATPERLAAVGDQLADAVISASHFTRTETDDQLTAAEAEVFFPYGQMLPVEEIERISGAVDQPLRADWARRHLEMARQGMPTKGEASIMQAMRVGPIALVAIPGEPAQEFGYEIERLTTGRSADVWPVGYANDQLGYLCTPRMYTEGGYEPTAYIVYDRPAPYRDEEEIVVKRAMELISKT